MPLPRGYIDEREFVVALYITNYLRVHQRKQKQQSTTASEGVQVLSPTDVFHQLDGDRDELLNVFEYEKALELLGVSRDTKHARAKALGLFPQSLVAMDLPAFKRAWVRLVNVHSELRKRNVDVSSGTSSQKKGGRTVEYLRSALLAEIDREEQEELLAALQAKEEVVRLEKQRREAEQEESRRLFQQQRHAATSTRTKEALRERQDNINRKKEREIKDRQAREERRLLQRAELETEKRTTHEREVVQDLMASKMERITRQKARCGDDIVDLRGRALKMLPAELYHGRDALTSLSSLLILDLARNRLQSLPGVIFTHLFSLQSLNVSENDLETLPEELGEARDLQMLDAHSNRLTVVPMGLKNLHQLRVLHLAYNRLVRFGDACGSLRSLEELNLAANALEVLADAMGDALVKLVHLNLRGNSALRRLPNSLQRLCCLTVWDLSACAQKRLSKGVFGAQLQSLRSLNLSFNALTTLSEGVGALKILQDLNIKANALATLPASVGHLTELVILNVENNALERLPATCGDQWGMLETLQLSHNRLSALPVTFGLLRSLRTLQLASNRLTKLPLELGALVNLRELDVSWNQLASLPEELGCLEALTALDLSHNKLAVFPETIAMWQQLTSLRCSHNALTTPLTTAFGHLQTLQYADLAQNQLSALEPCLYELRMLEVLNLAGNCIALLPREMAQHCVALRKLDLHSNRLRALPVELADGLLAQLEVLSIGRNPLSHFPAKCSSKWRLEDQYQASFANGYTPAEAKSWLIDQQAIYPEIVRVWDEFMAPAVGPEGSGEAGVDFVGSCISVAKVSSDEFCRRVITAMATSWQPRYERLVRHYFYEFKYVGHAIVFNASDQQQYGKQNAVFEMELQRQRQELADRVIQESNEDRSRLEAVYHVDQALATQTAERLADKRDEQRQRLLENGRHEAQALNVVVSEKLAISLRIREEAQQRQRTAFADEMRRLARERLQAKQQRRSHEGKGGNRKIVAIVTDEREEGERSIT
ncbi:hypothetical protein BBJ28_00006806 [Nothophytophthora sp. Chile5]|nr:hypothetical protein BBJ28_00006806 [Nothophytophthora sp. Chile5]